MIIIFFKSGWRLVLLFSIQKIALYIIARMFHLLKNKKILKT
jgi:hypothetical protein